jgi:hypothetical protein
LIASTPKDLTAGRFEGCPLQTNPIANLISVPLQYNYDKDIGPNDDGSKSVLNIQLLTT